MGDAGAGVGDVQCHVCEARHHRQHLQQWLHTEVMVVLDIELQTRQVLEVQQRVPQPPSV